ncbi:S8 family serine peptidase, partial [candidate division KSB1 bacterium]
IKYVFKDHYYAFIQFNEVPTIEKRETLEQSGIIFLDYIPYNTYVVRIPVNYELGKLRDFNIRSIIAIDSRFKTHPDLFDPPFPDWAMVGNDHIDITIKYYDDLNYREIEPELRKEKLLVIGTVEEFKKMTIRIHVNDIEYIAELPFVAYVEPVSPPSYPDDTKGKSLHRSNAINTDYATGRHYDGTGVHAALADDGAIGPHIDFTGRLTQYVIGLGGDHGDMTSGILMGAGNLNPTIKGMATGAHLHLYDISNYPHIVYADSNLINLGTVITSTSYSQNCGGEYTIESSAVDQQLHQNPSLIHVFSAGNAGTSNCNYGAGSSWGNITGGIKASKNVIATGNLDYIDNLQNSSSRGPAKDGRIKPDICANGYNQLSTDENQTYQIGGGTSAAAPGIAGILAQLYQAYKELNNGNNPEAPLMKACLLNTAEDLGNKGPDFTHGWGRVNALRALRTIEENRYWDSTITQGITHHFALNIPPSTKQVKVMCYWLDKEGSVTASKALVNDLNMYITGPDSTVYLPWRLDPTPNPVTLNYPAEKGNDSLNNMEQVAIDTATAGIYTITIQGFQVPQGPQKYYIVYEFHTDQVEVTYPIGGEGFVPGETETIRWDAYGNTSGFTLEYSINNGITWNYLATIGNPEQRYFNWTVPGTITGEALVKVNRGAYSDSSDVPFSIINYPSNLNINWACPDSFQLSWNSVNGAIAYEINLLGSMYMDSIGMTTNTSYVISGINPIDEYWLSVRAIDSAYGKGRRAYAMVKNPGIWNCNLTFDAEISIKNPSTALLQNCQDYSNSNIEIEITNNGISDITNPDVFFTLNNGNIVIETYSGTIASGNTIGYIFNTSVNLSSAGDKEIKAWISIPNDGNKYNDTTINNFKVINGSLIQTDSTENFENQSFCSTESNCEGTICSLINGWQNVSNGNGDDIDWRVDIGGTPSGNTGPSTDHTLGSLNGRYIYLEASNGCYLKEAQLISPCIDLTNSHHPVLDFWYHMYGTEMGSLHVDVLKGTSWDIDVMPVINSNQGDLWRNETIDLSSYLGEIINIRFRGITGAGYRSDIALDDIAIIETSGAGFEEKYLNATIHIYPNPASNFVKIDMQIPEVNEFEVKIVNPQGKTIKSELLDNNAENVSHKLDINDLSAGIYYIVITTNQFIKTEKLVIQ